MRKLSVTNDKADKNGGFFHKICDVSKGRDLCIDEVFRFYGESKIEFYNVIGDCLRAIGFVNVKVTRGGDTNNRMDAIVIDQTRSIPIEIKSPKEVEYVNVKAIRQALENKIILLSRKWYQTSKEVTSLAIGFKYPNDRSEVNNLIEDFEKTFEIKIGYIDFKTLLKLRWEKEIENKAVDLEKIYYLKGEL